jgi:hypothetical protein
VQAKALFSCVFGRELAALTLSRGDVCGELGQINQDTVVVGHTCSYFAGYSLGSSTVVAARSASVIIQIFTPLRSRWNRQVADSLEFWYVGFW